MPDGDPLDALRDIHLPPDPAFWPPAPGWWALAALALLLGGALLLHQIRAARRRRPQREALCLLAALREDLAGGREPGRVVAESATLLRRAALGRFPREQVAGLSGRAWLEFLERHGGGPEFTRGVGEQLLSAPYSPRAEADARGLLRLCERWIRGNG